jgi:hypothetical protein
MRTALDEFEQALIDASRALSAREGADAEATISGPTAARPERRVRLGRIGRLSATLPLVWVAVGASALAATGGAVALLFSGNSVKTIASFECSTTHNDGVGVPAITGSPLSDCRAWWGSATAGRRAAPPLTAWGAAGRALDAVVQPTAWGAPPATRLKTGRNTSVTVRWQKLPVDWTVNLGVVELTDQLNAVASGMSEVSACTYPARALQVVRSLFAADNLSGWRVTLQALHGGPVSPSCRVILANVDGGIRTVQLLQAPAATPSSPPASLKPRVRKLDQAYISVNATLNHKLSALQTEVSRTLATRCASVSAAAALWSLDARAAGFRATTLAYYRAINANRNPLPGRWLDYYMLIKQPASQHTGKCAHVLVMRYGGGTIAVYAARIAP